LKQNLTIDTNYIVNTTKLWSYSSW